MGFGKPDLCFGLCLYFELFIIAMALACSTGLRRGEIQLVTLDIHCPPGVELSELDS
jgi:hypothetical protein